MKMCPTSKGLLRLCLYLTICIVQITAQLNVETVQLETKCNNINRQLDFGQKIFIRIGGLTSAVAIPNLCLAIVHTDPKYELQVDVSIIRCSEPSVEVRVQYDGGAPVYACRSNPSSASLRVRGNQVTVGLQKALTAYQYSMEIVIKPTEVPFDPDNTESSPVSAGLVAGIVCSIFGALIIFAIFCICCHKRAKRAKRYVEYHADSKLPLEDQDVMSNGRGFNNTGTANDYESSPRSKTKLLSENEKTQSSGRSTQSNRSQDGNSIPPKYNDLYARPNKSFGYEEEDDMDPYDVMDGDPIQPKPKSPFLSALHANSKFKKTFEETEKDAENRRKRISSSSMDQSQDSNESGESTPPPLPSVPMSRSPGAKKKNHASIRRVPRTPSFSSDEPPGKSGDDTDDPNIRVVRDYSSNESPSSSEVIPIKVQNSTKPDTRHTLRPNRGGRNPPEQKTPELKSINRKNREKDDSRNFRDHNDDAYRRRQDDIPPSRVGQFQKYEDGIRSSKRSNKSPRMTSKGLGHRRRDDSRPTTPNSMAYDDDLESLPRAPLERTTSKNSLYASRSSLYNRRRRKNSFGESVSSYAPTYAHDDIDFYKRRSHDYSRDYEDDDSDGYVQPISRQEKERMFRSLGDLEHDRREKLTTATQTLRETATQTGKDQKVVMSKKRVVQKKRRSKSLSAAGTQTKRDKKREGRSSESEGETIKKEKKKASERKDTEVSEKPKVKPKPKPKPRKSLSTQSADTTKEEIAPEEKKKKKKKKKEDKTENTVENTTEPSAQQYPSGVTAPYIVPGQPYLQYGAPPGYQTLPSGQVVPTQPAFGVHPQAYGIRPPAYSQHMPPQQQPQAAPLQAAPRKSNWELLCDLTDPNKVQPDDVTSMASSVFTHHLPGNYPSYPNMQYGQPPLGSVPVGMIPHGSSSTQPPPPGIKGEVTQISAPQHESKILAEGSQDSESSYETESETESEEEEEMNQGGYRSDHGSIGKSSWDALKELSEKQKTSGAKVNINTEVETSSKLFTVV